MPGSSARCKHMPIPAKLNCNRLFRHRRTKFDMIIRRQYTQYQISFCEVSAHASRLCSKVIVRTMSDSSVLCNGLNAVRHCEIALVERLLLCLKLDEARLFDLALLEIERPEQNATC